jgi:hypothetical protein
MKRIKSFFKSFVSVLIVMLGAYLTGFYLRNEFSFTSVTCGIIGFFILFPAIKKLNETLWGSDANQE